MNPTLSRPLRAAAFLVVTALLLLGLGARAEAQNAPSLAFSPASAPAGSVITIEGFDFQAGEAVDLMYGGSVLARGTADGQGHFRTQGRIDSAMPVGGHPLEASGSMGSYVDTSYTVSAPAAVPAGTANPMPTSTSTPAPTPAPRSAPAPSAPASPTPVPQAPRSTTVIGIVPGSQTPSTPDATLAPPPAEQPSTAPAEERVVEDADEAADAAETADAATQAEETADAELANAPSEAGSGLVVSPLVAAALAMGFVASLGLVALIARRARRSVARS